MIAPIALAFAVLDVESSASALGFVLAARTVPNVVLLPVGGVWADRLSRHRVMVGSNVVQFASQSATAAILLSGTAQLWHLAALQGVAGAASAFFLPASAGLTPQTVSPRRLQQANALLSLTRSSAGILGPVIAGLLVATAGAGWAIAFDALTFAGGAAFLLPLRLPPDAVAPKRGRFITELREGWDELRTRSWVWVSILGFMSFHLFFIAPFFVLGPLIAKQSLGGASAWALIVAGLGVGSVLGDVLGLRYEPARPLFAGKLVMFASVPALILLGGTASAIAIAVAAALAGAALAFHDTLWFTVLQEKVPKHALSRVSSYDYMGSFVLRPLGYAVVGPVVAVIGIEPTLLGAAAVIVAVHLAMLAVPSIREMKRDTAAIDSAAEPVGLGEASQEP